MKPFYAMSKSFMIKYCLTTERKKGNKKERRKQENKQRGKEKEWTEN